MGKDKIELFEGIIFFAQLLHDCGIGVKAEYVVACLLYPEIQGLPEMIILLIIHTCDNEFHLVSG